MIFPFAHKSVRPSRRARQHLVRRTLSAGCAVGSILLSTLALSGTTAGAAAPSSTTDVIHLFARYGPTSFTSASGQTLATPPQTFAAGDVIESSDTDYVGSHAHHAKVSTASDHEMCIFSGPMSATCYGEVAMGGSMILAEFALEMSPQFSAPIDGGTGSFEGATGSVHFVDLTPNAVNSNSDITLTVDRP